jgi:hypothetical protein
MYSVYVIVEVRRRSQCWTASSSLPEISHDVTLTSREFGSEKAKSTGDRSVPCACALDDSAQLKKDHKDRIHILEQMGVADRCGVFAFVVVLYRASKS